MDAEQLRGIDRVLLMSGLPESHEYRRAIARELAGTAVLIIRPAGTRSWLVGEEPRPETFTPRPRNAPAFAILCELLATPGKPLQVANAKTERERVHRAVERLAAACPAFGFLRDEGCIKAHGTGALVYHREGRRKVFVSLSHAQTPNPIGSR